MQLYIDRVQMGEEIENIKVSRSEIKKPSVPISPKKRLKKKLESSGIVLPQEIKAFVVRNVNQN